MKYPAIVRASIGWALISQSVLADPALDAETHADQAYATYGMTGRGVIVAILDRGIDWSHPDFINEDRTTRIKYLLDMTGQSYCDPGNAAAVEFTESDINAALMGGAPIDSRDAVGHGTVTAGLAAGNGRAFADGRYAGLAPEADLIIVKITSDGANAHDGELSEAPFYGCVEEALTWLDEKVSLLGKPCVALINSGVQWGPLDGTSATSRKIDEVFGESRRGRVYVAASGDEGGFPTHAGAEFGPGPFTVTMDKLDDGLAYLSMWYSGAVPSDVTIEFDDGGTVGPVPPGGFGSNDGISIYQYEPGQAFYPWQSSGPDRAVGILIVGHTGPGRVILTPVTRGEPGRFDLYHADVPSHVHFTSSLVPGRLTDYASTHSAIVSGCYVLRNSYFDIFGNFWDVSHEGSAGQLWEHSSGGPTRDGRLLGVDVCSPGHNSFAAYAPNSEWATAWWNIIQDGGGWYGGHGATSASAPVNVGAVALILQMNPRLSVTQVRAFLRDTARSDAETGPVPNADWGYGKLDVFAALSQVKLCLSDTNLDGHVSFADITAVLTNFGVNYSPSTGPGDTTGDGPVNFADITVVLTNWGSECPS